MSGWEIAAVVVASLVGAFVKSVTGMGYPLLAVPLLALVLGVEDAVVIVAAPNVTANFLLAHGARAGRARSRDLGLLVGFGMAGAVFGTFALVTAPEEPLLIALVATIAVFVVNAARSPELAIAPAMARRWSPPVGALAGAMQGAVGVSGPLVAAWLHAYRLPKDAYVFSVTMIFGLSGAVQLCLLAGGGELRGDRIWLSSIAFAPVLAMIPVGTALRARLGGRAFEHAVLAVLLASAVALVVRIVA